MDDERTWVDDLQNVPVAESEPDELVLDVEVDNIEMAVHLDAARAGDVIGAWELHRVEGRVQYWRMVGHKGFLVRREVGA